MKFFLLLLPSCPPVCKDRSKCGVKHYYESTRCRKGSIGAKVSENQEAFCCVFTFPGDRLGMLVRSTACHLAGRIS